MCPEIREGFDKWKFMVNTKEDLKGRILDIEELIRENEEKIKRIRFEISCLFLLCEENKHNLRNWNK